MMYVPQGSKCPKCGEPLTISPPSVKKAEEKPPRKTPIWLWIFIAVALVALVATISILIWVNITKDKNSSSPDIEEEVIIATEEETEVEEAIIEEEDTSPYEIGVIQLIQHDSLDKATQGFRDVLTEKLGDKVTFDVQYADGDYYTSSTIANYFINNDVDLIMANSTPALQAAAASIVDIPILATSVTNYGAALGIDDFNGYTNSNISGTSDLTSPDLQAEMLLELFPETERVGLIYCSTEYNSKYEANEVARYLEENGIETTDFPFTNANDLQSVTESACEYSNVIYIPLDYTLAANTALVDSICREANVPVIAGEQGMCSSLGVATISVDYYQLGRITGMMAYEILAEDADIEDIPVRYNQAAKKLYNPELCEYYGIIPPAGYHSIYETDSSEDAVVAEEPTEA